LNERYHNSLTVKTAKLQYRPNSLPGVRRRARESYQRLSKLFRWRTTVWHYSSNVRQKRRKRESTYTTLWYETSAD